MNEKLYAAGTAIGIFCLVASIALVCFAFVVVSSGAYDKATYLVALAVYLNTIAVLNK